MRFFLVIPALMLLALAVRIAGWILSIGGWITREPDATSVSMFHILRAGASQGWSIAWPMLYSTGCIIIAITLACAAVLSLPVFVAWALRRQSPTVFLSYQNARMTLAQQLRVSMEAQGMTVRFVPFEPKIEHDPLLQRVVAALDGAQYMVCLPGQRNSFVEDEVFAASYACKPIVFVVDHPGGQLPNTGAKKYPVLRTQALLEDDFKPLTELLGYLHGGWRETLRLYLLSNAPVGWVSTAAGIAIGVVAVCMMLLGTAIWFGALTLFALEFYYSETVKVASMVVLFAGMVIAFGLGLALVALNRLVNGMSGIIRRQRAVSAARHAVRRGAFTDAVLRAAFEPSGGGDKLSRPAFLDALWTTPPDAHHEVDHEQNAEV